MELHAQIKKYRTNMKLSQEELAEKVYVTRQTISNWETGKSYPDIHSLLLLSNLFGISLDQLIKGDIEIMREEIKEADLREYNNLARVYGIWFILTIVSVVPLVKYLRAVGIIIWIAIVGITFYYAFKVQKFNAKHDLHTYKEIVAFTEGKRLDEIAKIQEGAKRPYQNVLKYVFGAVIGVIAATLGIWILG